MPSYSKNDVVLTRYPFADLSSTKVRPAIIISSPHESQDVFVRRRPRKRIDAEPAIHVSTISRATELPAAEGSPSD